MFVASLGAATVLRFLFSLILLQNASITRAALELNDVVKLGSTSRASSLLEGGADVSSRDNIGWTPLHNAANIGNVELVELLLEHRAEIDAKGKHYGRTALHLAAFNGEDEVVKTLLEAGAANNLTDVNGQTPLHLATWNGHLDASRTLLNHGADINAQDKFGSTAVRLAAIQKFDKVIEVLLTFCPDLRLLDNQGITVVDFASEKEFVDITTLFEEHRRNPCSRHKLQNVARQVHLTHNGKKCPRVEKHYLDLRIPYRWRLKETKAGTNASIPCPAGTNGTATWNCGFEGIWHRTPNLSNCQSLLFNGWQEVMATDNVTAAEVITTISNSIRVKKQGITLAPGDLITISGISEKLQDKHSQDLTRMTSGIDAWKLSMQYLNGTMELVDMMLAVPALWWSLDQHSRETTFTQLQKSVTFATTTLAAHQMESIQEFSVKSIATRVMHRSLGYFKSILLIYTHPALNQTTISLPYNFYDSYRRDQDDIKVSFVAYSGLQCTVNTVSCSPDEAVPDRDFPAANQVNSAIIGATVGDGSTWHSPLGEVVILKFQHVYRGDQYQLGERTCAWWDVTSNSWATDGCHLVDTNDHFSVCHCNHLTNLAVIMDINGVIDNTNVMHRVMRCVTIVGCVVSVVSLTFCVICFLAFKDIRQNTSSVIHANLCLCLMISEMVVLGSLEATHDKLICSIVVAVLHFFFLATFTWSAIEALHICLTSVKASTTKISLLDYYLVVGYLVPLLYVSLTLAFTYTQGYSRDKICWLSPQGLIWNFAGPLAVILLFNASAYLTSMYMAWCRHPPQVIDCEKSSTTKSTMGRDRDTPLWKNLNLAQQNYAKSTNKKKKKPSTNSSSLEKFNGSRSATIGHDATNGSASHSLGRRVGGSIAVLILLCLTWLSGFLYFLDVNHFGSHVLAVVFTLLNSLQGVSILVFRIVMNPGIMREVRSVLK